jgi:NAD-dependent dihydropyrimidine dehydrogenase PreA subunit
MKTFEDVFKKTWGRAPTNDVTYYHVCFWAGLKAIEMADGVATITLKRCIGCGLCVTTCPTDAIRLVKKPEDQFGPYGVQLLMDGKRVMKAFIIGDKSDTNAQKYINGVQSKLRQKHSPLDILAKKVFSNSPIDFPHLTTADILVAMSQGAYDIYSEEVKESGLILYDLGFLNPKVELKVKQRGIPATEISVKKLKNNQEMWLW